MGKSENAEVVRALDYLKDDERKELYDLVFGIVTEVERFYEGPIEDIDWFERVDNSVRLMYEDEIDKGESDWTEEEEEYVKEMVKYVELKARDLFAFRH